jgi:hypothetical protein
MHNESQRMRPPTSQPLYIRDLRRVTCGECREPDKAGKRSKSTTPRLWIRWNKYFLASQWLPIQRSKTKRGEILPGSDSVIIYEKPVLILLITSVFALGRIASSPGGYLSSSSVQLLATFQAVLSDRAPCLLRRLFVFVHEFVVGIGDSSAC